jgi:hypothetical protein
MERRRKVMEISRGGKVRRRRGRGRMEVKRRSTERNSKVCD